VAGPAVAARSESVTALTSDDVPAMVDLVARARPGPFRERTIELGNYYGHWIDGRLAAMAGHRFHLNGYREISAVCTDAAFRGRGLATELVRHLTALTEADGDAAFLHVSASNGAAIALYERLGFTLRRQVAFGALRPPVVTS